MKTNIVRGYYIFATIVFLLGVLLNDLSFYNTIILFVSYIFTGVLISRFSLRNHATEYLALVVYYVSVVFMPCLHLVIAQTFGGRLILSNLDYSRLITMGASLYLVVLISFFIVASFIKNVRVEYCTYRPRKIKFKSLNLLFLLMFFLTIFSFSIGLGRMGVEAVVLPFHLGGIINIMRFTFFPALFAVIIENFILQGKKVPKSYFVLYGIWCFFETFTRMSKGALISNTLPLLLVLYLYYRPSFKKVLRITVPIIAVFIFLYPIIGILRSSEFKAGTMVSDFKEAKEVSGDRASDESIFSPLLTPLNREFMTCGLFAIDYDYIDHQVLFDFSKAPTILLSGGTAYYQTFVIDEFPPEAVHSSGTTGIIDPLLIGGYGFCYIIVFATFIFARYVSRLYVKRRISSFILLSLLTESLITGANVSKPFDSVSMQYLLATLLVVYLSFLLNFRTRLKRVK